MFSNSKVGDKVWDFVHGYGKVTTISGCSKHPLEVKFNWFSISYTLQGLTWSSPKGNPTLFHDKITFTVPTPEPIPKWRWVIDTGVSGEEGIVITDGYYAGEEDFYKTFIGTKMRLVQKVRGTRRYF